MTGLNLDLSPSLSPAKMAADYQKAKRIHIPGILEENTAIALYQQIETFQHWDIHINQGDKTFDIVPEQRAAMTPAQLNDLRAAAYAGGQTGFQYIFENYPIYDAYHKNCCAESFLEEIIEFVNSEAFLAFTRTVTGHDDISFADAQLTRFTPGDFLSDHNDDVMGKGRRAAFVLNLTPDWCADFGGILQFFDTNGDVEAGFVPSFNALNIFSIPKPHAVSQVSTFAPRARYGITGWLRAGDDPKG
jgi:SM-20-related protein